MLEQAASILDVTVAQLELFFLVLVRMSAMVFLFPILKNRNVSARLKVGFAFILSVVIFPHLKDTQIPYTPEVAHLILIVMKEVAVGIIIGFAGGLLFVFVDFGGEVINRNVGLSMMPMLNPETGENSTSLTQLIMFIFLIMFLLNNHHFFFIEVMAESYTYIPVMGLEWDAQKFSHVFTYMVSEALVTGLRLAAPVLVTTLLVLLGLAFMSRAMPNLNVWMVSMPVKIFIGILTLIYVFPMMYQLFDQYLASLQWNILTLMKIGGGHG